MGRRLDGFGRKLTPAGALSDVLQYRMGGREAKTQCYSIGAHGSPWTLATARTKAERLLLVAEGIDPSEADRKRRDDAVNLAFPLMLIGSMPPARATAGGRWSRAAFGSMPSLTGILPRPLDTIARKDRVSLAELDGLARAWSISAADPRASVLPEPVVP